MTRPCFPRHDVCTSVPVVRPWRRRTVLALLAILFVSRPLSSSQTNAGGGVSTGAIVEAVAPGLAGEVGGLRPGTVITSWVRTAALPANPMDARGSIRSPFDLTEIETEQAPRGAVTLEGTRGNERVVATLGPGDWGIEGRPAMSASVEAAFRDGQTSVADGQYEDAARHWQLAGKLAADNGDAVASAWLSLRLATILAARRPAPRGAPVNPAPAIAAFDAAISAARAGANALVEAQVLEASADALSSRGAFEQATDRYVSAAQVRARTNPRTLAFAQVLRKQAGSWRTSVTPAALGDFGRNGFDLDADATKTLDAAEQALAQAFRIAEVQAPRSRAVSRLLNEQALVAARRLQIAGSSTTLERAAAIEGSLVPGAPEAAAAARTIESFKLRWQIFANALTESGGRFIEEQAYLVDVERDLDRAREIWEQLYPGCDEAAQRAGGTLVRECRNLARALNNLSMVTAQRGNPGRGEQLGHRALRLKEALRNRKVFDPPSPGAVVTDTDAAVDIGRTLNNLGTIAWLRGNFDMATDYYARSLELLRSCGRACDGRRALGNRHLAKVALARGDLDGAESRYKEALPLDEVALQRADPGFLTTPLERAVATDYKGLGDVANALHDRDAARRLYLEALARQRQAVPKSLELVQTLERLGAVTRDRGDFSEAQRYLREAVAMANELVPDSIEGATASHTLATSFAAGGHAKEAAEYFSGAIAMLEVGTTRLGGTDEVRSRYVARRNTLYYDYIRLLVDQQDQEGAFHVLERSRAQSLRTLLAERDLTLGEGIPAPMERERREINREHDAVDAQLRRQESDPAPLRARLRTLLERRQALADKMREASPRLAGLAYPRPLTAAAAREALDPGTALLAYSVGDSDTLLFVLQPNQPPGVSTSGLDVFRLPVGRAQLEEEIRNLRATAGVGSGEANRTRNMIAARSTGKNDSAAFEKRSAALFDALIKPAYAVIAAQTRLLIAPDGPLHGLPFAALIERDAPTGGHRYLIEWKPIHITVSTTVYAEMKRSRWNPDRAAATELVAFGDPDYGVSEVNGASSVKAKNGDEQTTRSGLRALPDSGVEVKRITELYRPRAEAFLGPAATEERLKTFAGTATTPRFRYLHVASHGRLDNAFPLNSALVLSIPTAASGNGENGLLQAWEIYEQLRIDADLVVLSACETGSGQELGGEGLFSLSRAFLYAGARSVLASSWAVNDASTAELMTRFYTYLKSGRPKDDALRAAQIDLIRGRAPAAGARSARGEWSRPYHWAAFFLNGDWR